MPKKRQSALLFILAGIMCFAAAVRCSSFRWAGFGRRSGILINEQWVGHRTEADHEAEGISKLDVTNVLTPVHIIRNKKSRVITVKIVGLPDTAVKVSSKDGIFNVTEKDIRRLLRSIFDRRGNWYIDSDITVAVPPEILLSEIRLNTAASVQMENIKADSVQISGVDASAIMIRQCNFRSLSGKTDDSRMEMRNSTVQDKLVFSTEDGGILIKDVSAPSAEYKTQDGNIQADRVSFDELICHTGDGSIAINGTIAKKADVTSRDGHISLDLQGAVLAEKLAVYTRDGSIALKALSVPLAEIETGDGRIRMGNVSFETVRCRSEDGSIGFAGEVKHTADFSTGDGSITADMSKSKRIEKLILHTKDGHIILKNATAASADIKTEDGSCTAERCFLTDAHIEASGNIQVDGDLCGACRLTSKDGNIVLNLSGAESDYAIASGCNTKGATVIGNLTLESATQSSENVPIVAGSASAPNKLFLFAEDGKITIKTK